MKGYAPSRNARIACGYYLKARCIQESAVAHAPPHVREIWDWLLKEANHKDRKVSGKIIRRGQCIRSYRDIQEGLHWMVGWRKEKYSKHACETAMKWLKKAAMITTKKTTRGLNITICNYDYYQNPGNYESHEGNYKKTKRKPHTSDTINKNDNNDKNGKNEDILRHFEAIWNQYPNKIRKKEAYKHFKTSVKDDEAIKQINLALANYKTHLKNNPWKQPQNGSTWFNNWRDWIDYIEPSKNAGMNHEKNRDNIGKEFEDVEYEEIKND